MTVGILHRRRTPEEIRLAEILAGSRTVAQRLDDLTDRLEAAVERLSSEISDPNDHPDREGST